VDSAEYIEGDMEVQWMIMASGYVVGKADGGRLDDAGIASSGLGDLRRCIGRGAEVWVWVNTSRAAWLPRQKSLSFLP
jgi:hypothetical protein